MDDYYKNLIVEKTSNKFVFLTIGFLIEGLGLFILIILLKSFTGNTITIQSLILNLFALLICIPLGLYYLIYAFGNSKLFEINATGIKTPKLKIITWESIYQIETTKYTGPRIFLYRIKIIQDIEGIKKMSIWFSSDINTDWSQIIESLSHYATQYNFSLT